MIVKCLVGFVTIAMGVASMAAVFSEELNVVVDASIGSTRLYLATLAAVGVYLLVLRKEYQPLFER